MHGVGAGAGAGSTTCTEPVVTSDAKLDCTCGGMRRVPVAVMGSVAGEGSGVPARDTDNDGSEFVVCWGPSNGGMSGRIVEEGVGSVGTAAASPSSAGPEAYRELAGRERAEARSGMWPEGPRPESERTVAAVGCCVWAGAGTGAGAGAAPADRDSAMSALVPCKSASECWPGRAELRLKVGGGSSCACAAATGSSDSRAELASSSRRARDPASCSWAGSNGHSPDPRPCGGVRGLTGGRPRPRIGGVVDAAVMTGLGPPELGWALGWALGWRPRARGTGLGRACGGLGLGCRLADADVEAPASGSVCTMSTASGAAKRNKAQARV